MTVDGVKQQSLVQGGQIVHQDLVHQVQGQVGVYFMGLVVFALLFLLVLDLVVQILKVLFVVGILRIMTFFKVPSLSHLLYFGLEQL